MRPKAPLPLRDQLLDPAVPWPCSVANVSMPYGMPRLFDHPDMQEAHGPVLSITHQYQSFLQKSEAAKGVFLRCVFSNAPKRSQNTWYVHCYSEGGWIQARLSRRSFNAQPSMGDSHWCKPSFAKGWAMLT